MRIALPLLISLLGFTVGVQAAPTQAQQDEAVIRQTLAAWVAAYNSGDYATAGKVWAPDLIGWPASGPDDSFAREAEALKHAPQGKSPTTRYKLTIEEVMVSGDMAVVRDIWTEVPEQGQSKQFRSYEVWRRQSDGAWKIARWIDGPETTLTK